jgi:hypothetical protein
MADDDKKKLQTKRQKKPREETKRLLDVRKEWVNKLDDDDDDDDDSDESLELQVIGFDWAGKVKLC